VRRRRFKKAEAGDVERRHNRCEEGNDDLGELEPQYGRQSVKKDANRGEGFTNRAATDKGRVTIGGERSSKVTVSFSRKIVSKSSSTTRTWSRTTAKKVRLKYNRLLEADVRKMVIASRIRRLPSRAMTPTREQRSRRERLSTFSSARKRSRKWHFSSDVKTNGRQAVLARPIACSASNVAG
jgi:hypothetical protein